MQLWSKTFQISVYDFSGKLPWLKWVKVNTISFFKRGQFYLISCEMDEVYSFSVELPSSFCLLECPNWGLCWLTLGWHFTYYYFLFPSSSIPPSPTTPLARFLPSIHLMGQYIFRIFYWLIINTLFIIKHLHITKVYKLVLRLLCVIQADTLQISVCKWWPWSTCNLKTVIDLNQNCLS